MRILFLTRYAQLGASTRYRFWQFVTALAARGHKVECSPLLNDDYLRRLYSGRRRSLLRIAFGFARRLYYVIRSSNYDLVVLYIEAFPWMPVFLERLLFYFNPNVVLDLDDAWYEVYSENRFLKGKIPWLMRNSRVVVAGSEVIAQFSRQFNQQTVLIPTVVDVNRYIPIQKGSAQRAKEIVWIGSPVTANLLLPYRNVWQTISDLYPDISFKLIGAGDQFDMKGVRHRVVAWSEATEVKELAMADIGIMPLQNDEFQRGKCALKIIQYMAAGLPVVASAIGANNDVVLKGQTGLLPSSDKEWVEALSALIENHSLRTRMGDAGRQRAEQLYSIDSVVPVLESVYLTAAGIGCKSSRTIFEPNETS